MPNSYASEVLRACVGSARGAVDDRVRRAGGVARTGRGDHNHRYLGLLYRRDIATRYDLPPPAPIPDR
jgi:hypothetical protein